MPVNSFENYPMSWKPERFRLKNPLYLSIASLLEQDIASGKLPPHTMLPPQRELADFLDLNLSTITRAYKACELKGLIYAITGKGTYVSPNINLPNVLENHEQITPLIEMGVIKPFYETNSIVLDTIRALTKKSGSEALLEYSNPLGTHSQKQNAQKWLSRFQINTPIENILIASGAQNALTIILASLFKPGDKIATDMFTHPNFISLANMLGIQLIPVAGDDCGMLPETLDAICKSNNISGIYLMPSCSNPTNITMPMTRRKELSFLIKKHKLILLEDDVYAFLLTNEFLPMFEMVPEHSVYICSTSKSICAGLRVAFAALSDCFLTRLVSGVYNINLKTSSLNVEVVSELINNGTADMIVNKKIELARSRTEVFDRSFPHFQTEDGSVCFFEWIPLPGDMNGILFEKLAEASGVHVFSSDRFAVGNTMGKSYVRLALSSPSDIPELEKGLGIIQSLLKIKDAPNLKSEFIV
jgi:DNA-binding transcriptional MocR family regulator